MWHRAGPHTAFYLGCSMILSKDVSRGPFNSAVCHDTCPTNPRLVLALSLLFGSFSFCPHSGRLTGSCDSLYVTQISTFQNFPLWLIFTSSPLSSHPYYMVSDPSGKHHGDLLFPLLATNWPFMLHVSASKIRPLSSVYPFYVQLLKFCVYGIKLCLLSPF